jgi:hypothetical protein
MQSMAPTPALCSCGEEGIESSHVSAETNVIENEKQALKQNRGTRQTAATEVHRECTLPFSEFVGKKKI